MDRVVSPLFLTLKGKIRRCVRLMFLAIFVLSLAGCSTLDISTARFKDLNLSDLSLKNLKARWERNDPSYDLIANNLVNSLAQVPLLNPLLHKVRIPEPVTKFDMQVKDALLRRGYLVEENPTDNDSFAVHSSIKNGQTSAGMHNIYSLSLGPVNISRAYEVVKGHTRPISRQRISGTNKRSIAINDHIFSKPDSEYTASEFLPLGEEGEIIIVAVPVEKAASGVLAVNQSNLVKRNLFDIGQSNYVEVFDDYVDVEQTILVFPNDSLRLGTANKNIIDRYVSKMDPNTDVLSVIGCSIGRTNIKNGNSLLALGRANRVKEAFLFSGLDHDQVLEEGCWAQESYGKVLPTRGVVVTLKRQKRT